MRDYCEERLVHEPNDLNIEPDIKMVKQWHKTLTHEAYDETFDQETGWDNFMQFELALQNQDIYEPVMAEVKLHTDEQISGMVDMLYRNKQTGEYLICDWKRAKDLTKQIGRKKGYGPCERYPDSSLSKYTIQVTFYAWALRKYYNINVTEAWIIGLHPNKQGPEIIPVELQAHIQTVEDMIKKVSCTVYLSVLNYTDMNLVKYTKEGMKRRTKVIRSHSDPPHDATILTHTDDVHGFQVVVHHITNTPLHALSSEIYVPYIDQYKEQWMQWKQDVYDDGYPLNIDFVFVKINE